MLDKVLFVAVYGAALWMILEAAKALAAVVYLMKLAAAV